MKFATKCNFDNSKETFYWGKCGTRFPFSEEITISQIKSLETPKEELTKGATFLWNIGDH